MSGYVAAPFGVNIDDADGADGTADVWRGLAGSCGRLEAVAQAQEQGGGVVQVVDVPFVAA